MACNGCNSETLDLCSCSDGKNSFTVSSANFTMPAEGATVVITVSNLGQYTGQWAISGGQVIYIQAAGYFQVVNSTTTTITALNLKNTATGAYASNAAPATIITSGVKISPAGLQGITGLSGVSNDLINIDYTIYTNTTNGLYTTQVIKSLGTGQVLQQTGDTVTFEIEANSNNANSLLRLQLYDTSSFVNLLPAPFVGGLATGYGGRFKFTITRASSSTVNLLFERTISSFTGALNGDSIFFNITSPVIQVYRTLGLGSLNFSNALSLILATDPVTATKTVRINFTKTTKESLI